MADPDRTLKELGFSSNGEFFRMVAAVDLDSPEKIAALKRWQREDGTRAGLAALPMKREALNG